MRKLLLAIFLLSISNNALAKVEIWECDITKYGDLAEEELSKDVRIFKLDTGPPTKVHERVLGKWETFMTLDYWYYDKENESIIYNNGRVFDLIFKELQYFRDDNEVYATYKCKVIE